ncbi:MAG: carbohydrate kinase [Streptosporangiales bacterium]|nr:carbohydrate kinase [Streptosporangiales bacterium]
MTVAGSAPLYVGVDLGTQSVRALCVDGAGVVHGAGSAALTSRRDEERHEQDPRSWWQAVGAACRQAVAGVPADAVAAVAVDGTSGTVVLTDAAGEPLSPGVMYDDTRAADEVAEINEVGAPLWQALGYGRVQAAWALPKLRKLLRDATGARVAHQADFVAARLAGRPVAADTSNALKSGCDLRAVAWPAEVFDRLGIPLEALPDLVLPGTEVATVGAAAAAETGLPEGASIIAGMTDGCAAQLGAGALDVGSWNAVLGTTLVLKGVTGELVHDPLGAVYSHRAPDGGWLPGGASSTGAGALTARLAGCDLDALADRAGGYEPSSALAYPLAASRGERFPFVAPEATGFVIGDAVDDVDLYAALVQGIAYVERLCFDYLDLLQAPTCGRLVLTGGAARSRYFCQLRADVLGRPVTLVDNAEPALGMAVLAAYGVGAGSLPECASRMVRVTETLEPSDRRGEVFKEPYARLVDELRVRGWLDARTAAHALERASAR